MTEHFDVDAFHSFDALSTGAFKDAGFDVGDHIKFPNDSDGKDWEIYMMGYDPSPALPPESENHCIMKVRDKEGNFRTVHLSEARNGTVRNCDSFKMTGTEAARILFRDAGFDFNLGDDIETINPDWRGCFYTVVEFGFSPPGSDFAVVHLHLNKSKSTHLFADSAPENIILPLEKASRVLHQGTPKKRPLA